MKPLALILALCCALLGSHAHAATTAQKLAATGSPCHGITLLASFTGGQG